MRRLETRLARLEAASPPRSGVESMSDQELCDALNTAFGYERYVLLGTPLPLVVRKEHPYLPDAEEEAFWAALRESLRK